MNNLDPTGLNKAQAAYIAQQMDEMKAMAIMPPLNLGMTARSIAYNSISAHVRAGRFQVAIAKLDDALTEFGEESGILIDQAYCWRHLNEPEKARALYARAVGLGVSRDNPDRELAAALMWANYATCLIDLGDMEGATVAAITSMEVQKNPLGAWNLACARLMKGDLKAGWVLFHYRTMLPGYQAGRDYGVPYYSGDDPEEKPVRLLLVGEQGIGERVMYASLFDELAEKAGCELLIELASHSAKLEPLFKRSFPNAHIMLPSDAFSSRGTYQAYMGDLGPMFRPDLDSFPKNRGAWLKPDLSRRATFLELLGDKPVIGLSWNSINEEFGKFKSLNLIDLAPILRVPGVTFVNLQYGDVAAEIAAVEAELGVKIHQMPGVNLFHDLDGAAALISACDQVVTVSNINAHLAGGLGVPVALMLGAKFGRVWYWMLEREDSPWYPSMRIFRREGDNTWASMVEKTAAYLGGLFHGDPAHR